VSLDIQQEAVTLTALQEYAAVSVAFVVDRILQVTVADGGLGGLSLTETAVPEPYVKDYDALQGAEPVRWLERFDTSNWRLIRGCRDGRMVGGAVVAFNTEGVRMLGSRDDIAVLWDIRVSPEERGAGLGSAVFQAAADWAVAHGCGWFKIETQNVNAAACRFYRKMGCTLGAIDRFAYPDLPDEVQLLWWKALAARSGRPSD
jgi:GNAT superfamily N-acetyltransferase